MQFAWRIFLTVREPPGRSTRLWPIIFVIIECSALYALGVIAALILFLSNPNGQYAAIDAIIPLVVSYALHLLTSMTQSFTHAQGIVFSLIILQIRFHLSVTASCWNDGKPTRAAVWGQSSAFPVNGEELRFPVSLQLIEMGVHVKKQTDADVSSDRTVRDSLPDFKLAIL